MLFQPLQDDVHKAVAKQLIQHGIDTFEGIKARYEGGLDVLWGREGFTVADAQAVIDELGAQAIPVFVASAALGQFINTVAPGTIPDEQLASPVPYTIDENGRIVLDPNALYPTEEAPSEE